MTLQKLNWLNVKPRFAIGVINDFLGGRIVK
jgi:hypothetical protein